ncbi:thioesterase II family protein [Brytella acorum]|uniref:Alpha/beta fold hydrolase n=1 Tax=Brytella acorum TaxID=2959299 RepID=A0AA35UQN6_9PROT|nr:alpha/beta fold hydrolase [Brytella acorum]CAI9121916.1 alpha/beta fold hydrolase [Brytella acorum]
MNGADVPLRRFNRAAEASVRLICLPHAGGSASAFRRWRDLLPDKIDLLAAQYPGREDRYADSFAPDIAKLADELADALSNYLDRPLLLFGHSMGASIAYEVALRLEKRGTPPARIIVSAHPPPHRQRDSDLHCQNDEALVADVRRLSDQRPSLLDDPEIRALFLPMLRADYRLIETYRCVTPVAVATPITVVLPVDDAEITQDEALAWQDCTLSPLTLHDVEGGHFYLQQHPERLIALLLPYLLTR